MRERKERSKILSENSRGKKNNFYGKKHTNKTKKQLSVSHSGKYYKSDAQKKLWIENIAKKPASEKQKKQLSDRNKKFILLQNKLTLEKIYIDRTKKNDYDLNVWLNPKKIFPEKKETCIYCGIVSTKGNVVRWHNDNCKRKPHEN